MLRALDLEDKKDVILDVDGIRPDALESIKNKCRSGRIVCPQCQQSLIARTGDVRIWHFAHKIRDNCPLSHLSIELLRSRLTLYKWLVSKFPGQATIEWNANSEDVPRPVDCHLNTKNGIFLYWIFEKGMRSGRDELSIALKKLSKNSIFLFLTQNIREDEIRRNSIHLSTTERHFMSNPRHNEIYSGDHTISYIDYSDDSITTYRGLRIYHSTIQYDFSKKFHRPIDQVKIDPTTGEFVYDDEHDKFEELQKKREEARKKRLDIEKWDRKFQLRKEKIIAAALRSDRKATPSKGLDINSPIPCEKCGVPTNDWYSYDGKTKTCKCKNCFTCG